MKRIMWRKMTSARLRSNAFNIFIVPLVIIIFSSFPLLTSCKIRDNPDEQIIDYGDYKNESSLYLFDYEEIVMESTGSIDVKIENCNLYLDIYEDLVILGEVKNVSKVNKTDIEITIDFYDKHGEKIISAVIPAYINYLGGGRESRLPFWYYLTEREQYIDISKIKIGVNYKDYYERFEGDPIVENESYYYKEDYLIIEGKIINIGEGKIRNLKLFCTFYNDKNQVVFIKQCYLSREEMVSEGEQKFTLRVLLDEYLPGFTHYRLEVFFEDEIKAPV
ncbi:MAG: hypothetical protein HQ569_09380 [Actinobacteria bacterium]|nr:hypothetical protein [Actinomycetota bacterium]